MTLDRNDGSFDVLSINRFITGWMLKIKWQVRPHSYVYEFNLNFLFAKLSISTCHKKIFELRHKNNFTLWKITRNQLRAIFVLSRNYHMKLSSNVIFKSIKKSRHRELYNNVQFQLYKQIIIFMMITIEQIEAHTHTHIHMCMFNMYRK